MRTPFFSLQWRSTKIIQTNTDHHLLYAKANPSQFECPALFFPTKNQQWVFDKKIKPALSETCAAPGCTGITRIGRTYCPTCEIEFG
jgi:hypothetical protein